MQSSLNRQQDLMSDDVQENESLQNFSVSKKKVDFAMLRIENDIREYYKNRTPTKNCLTKISELQPCTALSLLPSNQSHQQMMTKQRDHHQVQLLRVIDQINHETNKHDQEMSNWSNGSTTSNCTDKAISQNCLGKITIQIEVLGGIFKNSVFQFQIYFLAKYPYAAPRVFLSQYSNATQTQLSLPFIEPLTKEVKLKILQEEWNPVLSLQMIILALELQVGEEHNDQSSQKNDMSSLEFQQEFYEYQKSKSKCVQMQPNFTNHAQFHQQPSHHNHHKSTLIKAFSKKRKYQEFHSPDSSASSFSEIEANVQNPVKRLRREMDSLQLSSPMGSGPSTNGSFIINNNEQYKMIDDTEMDGQIVQQ